MIEMADPAAQYARDREAIDAAVARVLASGRYVGGAEVTGLERALAAYLKAETVIGTSSGSTALHAVLLALGVGPGAEVILPAYTFCATVEAVLHVGATPVLVDIDDDYLMDVKLLAAVMGPRTAAVIAVNLFGLRCPIDDIKKNTLNVEHRVPLIEDSAQSFGPDTPGGVAACYSFFPAKILGAAGDAGAIATNDAELGEQLRRRVDHGRRQGVSVDLGHNFRLDALQAAVLRVKLGRVDAMLARRRDLARRYREAFADLPLRLPGATRPDDHRWQCFCVELRDDRRDALATALRQAGIASAVYYRTPLHRHPAFVERCRVGPLPRSERAAASSLCLPIHADLSDDAAGRVADAVRAFFR